MTRRTGHEAHWLGGRALVVAGALAAAGMVAVGARGDASQPAQPPEAPAAAQLEAEAEAMVDAGMSPEDPKVEMLEEDAEAVQEASEAPPKAEPGVNMLAEAASGEIASSPAEARALEDEMRSDQPATLGAVECEPIPQLLTVNEVAGARCYSVPQPDGSSRFVAVTPSGKVLIVAFGASGEVRRLPQNRLPANARPATAQMTPTPGGDLTVQPPGAAAATVDLR